MTRGAAVGLATLAGLTALGAATLFSPGPGPLLVYVGLNRLAAATIRPGMQRADPLPVIRSDAHRQLVELLAIALPLMAALTLAPLGRAGCCRGWCRATTRRCASPAPWPGTPSAGP